MLLQVFRRRRTQHMTARERATCEARVAQLSYDDREIDSVFDDIVVTIAESDLDFDFRVTRVELVQAGQQIDTSEEHRAQQTYFAARHFLRLPQRVLYVIYFPEHTP